MNSVSPLAWQRLDKFCSTMHSLDAAFRGKGKKSEVSDVFAKLSQYPLTVDDEDLQILEKFVVIMYDSSSTAEGVDDARLDMFARKHRPCEAIPPTRAALLQHTKRAAYQAGCISGVNQQYIKINQKHRILQSGVGEKKTVCGTFSGQTFHLLPRVVSN